MKPTNKAVFGEIIIALMNTVGTGPSGLETNDGLLARKIIEDSAKRHGGLADRQEIFLGAINLFGQANTQREKLVLAQLYDNCHTEYTLYAIKAFEDYFRGEPYYPYKEPQTVFKPGYSLDMLNRESVSMSYFSLGALYERCYEFKKAIKCYQKAREYDNWSYFSYGKESNCYVKMGDFDSALKILNEAKHHRNYKEPSQEEQTIVYLNIFKQMVDKCIESVEVKKESGYKFVPRGHKEFIQPQ